MYVGGHARLRADHLAIALRCWRASSLSAVTTCFAIPSEGADIGTTRENGGVLDELDAAGGAEAFLRARGVSAVVLEQVRGRLLR